MSNAVLEIANLNKWYGRTHALRDLSLEVTRGQVCGLLGPNGSGKTTALGIVLGVLRASSGHFSWFGEGSRDRLKTRVGALLENPNFYPWMSARRNLEMVATIRGLADSRSEVDRVLGLVKLRNDSAPFQSFSLGMKQRLAIASAILGSPEVLVLDEPTNGIDAEGIAEIRRLITDLAAGGTTIILASHILDEVQKVCSHVVVLKAGSVLEIGLIDRVLAQDGWVELGGKSLDTLAEALKSYPGQSGVEVQGSRVRLRLSPETDLSQVNRFLVERGIYVSHLVKQGADLESHFLKLLERDHA